MSKYVWIHLSSLFKFMWWSQKDQLSIVFCLYQESTFPTFLLWLISRVLLPDTLYRIKDKAFKFLKSRSKQTYVVARIEWLYCYLTHYKKSRIISTLLKSIQPYPFLGTNYLLESEICIQFYGFAVNYHNHPGKPQTARWTSLTAAFITMLQFGVRKNENISWIGKQTIAHQPTRGIQANSKTLHSDLTGNGNTIVTVHDLLAYFINVSDQLVKGRFWVLTMDMWVSEFVVHSCSDLFLCHSLTFTVNLPLPGRNNKQDTAR